ncbi:MAG TPA: carbohydrate binding domain-containing protein [Candidatus Saccharimonadia bacterium]|nr:carbohydrate binding domain-containing protein [Candidatus Saccharimonadia bacterium]
MNKKNLYLVGFIILLNILVYRVWFLGFGIMTHGDWSYVSRVSADTLRIHYFSLWLSDYSFGRILVDVGQAPTYAFYGFLSAALQIDFALAERLVHLWPAVLLTPLGAFFLVWKIFKNRIAAILGAIIYSCNTYFLILLTGHLTLAGAYALAPWVLLAYLEFLEKESLRYGIWAGLLLSASSAYEPRAAYIIAWILVFAAAGQGVAKIIDHKKINEIISYTLRSIIPFAIFGLLNFFWIFAFTKINGAIGADILSRGLFGNAFYDINEALTLFHPFWNGGRPIPFIINHIPLYFWLLPVAATLGIFLNKSRRTIIFFATLGILGIFLTKQVDTPFPQAYQWLYAHFPGFGAYREASKFYLLIALSYTVLIPGAYIALKKIGHKYLSLGFAAALASIMVVNLAPIISGTIQTTFASRTIPESYTALNKLLDESSFSRTLWAPKDSRWALDSDMHPKVGAIDIAQSSWVDFIKRTVDGSYLTTEEQAMEVFQNPFAPELLADGVIKYVVVPLRDTKNDDDFFINYGDIRSNYTDLLDKMPFLKRVNTGINDIALYQNTNVKPYVSTFSNLYSIPGMPALQGSLNFAKQALGEKDFNFVSGEEKTYARKITDLFGTFEDMQPTRDRELASKEDLRGSTIYRPARFSEYEYRVAGNELQILSRDLRKNLGATRGVANAASFSIIKRINVAREPDIYLDIDGKITKLNASDNQEHYLGSNVEKIGVYSATTGNNVINGSFESGLWQDKVQDCNNYDGSPSISVRQSSVASDGKYSLNMTAQKHMACTASAPLPIRADFYLTAMDYKIHNGTYAAYQISNSETKEVLGKYNLRAPDDAWRTYATIQARPSGATNLGVTLMARPSEQQSKLAETNYDNVKIVGLKKLDSLDFGQNQFEPFQSGPTAYRDQAYTYENIVPNGSFENGLWEKNVGDCGAYDDKPKIGMNISTKASDGRRSLELHASRHIACTSANNIPIEPNGTYQITFDYTTNGTQSAGYSVILDDPQKTKITERISIASTIWKKYQSTFVIPPGAKIANITLYAYSEDDGAESVVRYDDLRVIKTPDITGKYFALTNANITVKPPKDISFKAPSQTARTISIRAATTPFYLAMAEAYHPDWRLEINNGKVKGLGSWLPWAKPDAVAAGDHFKLNDFENGWYVDVDKLCGQQKLCTQNADGSYDLEMVAEFTPQRWFYIGLIVSGGTLVACIGFLAWDWRRRRHGQDRG